MSPECSNLDPFFDGELPADAAVGFQAHLVSCERCQRVLRGRMQEEIVAEAAEPRVAQAAVPVATAARRRRVLYAAPILAAAAAMAIWIGVRAPVSGEPIELAVAIDHPSAATRSGSGSGTAHVGDVVRPAVRGEGHRALWVYRDDREVVAACPGGAGCSSDDQQLTLELRLGAPGSYSIIAIVSAQAIPQPRGSVDVMLSEVTGAGAHIKITQLEVN